MASNKLYIIPCSNEILVTGLDTENKSIRSYTCDKGPNKNVEVDLFKKQNRKTKGKCSNVRSNKDLICTYNESMKFVYITIW